MGSDLEVRGTKAVTAQRSTPPPDGATQDVIDNWLPPEARELIMRGKAPKTLQAYVRGFTWWKVWCEDSKPRVTLLPARQNAMVRFIKDWEYLPVHVRCHNGVQSDGMPCRGHRPSPSSLWIWYSALKWFHGIGDEPIPWEGGVKLSEAMSAYVSTMKDEGWEPYKAPRAYPHHIKAMVDAIDDADEDLVLRPAKKNLMRALVLTNYYTAGRSSDLARYRITSAEPFAYQNAAGVTTTGIQMLLNKSKAKQAERTAEYRTIFRDENDPRYDGVRAVDLQIAYLHDQGITTGALFRPVHKSGQLVRTPTTDALGYRMDGSALTRLYRHAAQLAGIPGWERFTLHSGRRGRVQRLLEEGADQYEMEEELGWAHGGAMNAYRAEVKRQSATAANAKGML